MNQLNNSHLKDTIISTFQEILAEDPNFFFTDRLSILTWKSKLIPGALITKIGNVRYLGLIRKDKQGQEYWKYKPLINSNPEQPGESPAIPPSHSPPQSEKEEINSEFPSTDKVAKFQQRQMKAQARQSLGEDQINNHAKPNNSEQSVNHS